jgi:hypothetical protein
LQSNLKKKKKSYDNGLPALWNNAEPVDNTSKADIVCKKITCLVFSTEIVVPSSFEYKLVQ